MRYTIPLLCVALCATACSKKDKVAPVVRVLSPSNDARFNSGETFTIEIEISDNEQVQSFSLKRINTTNFGLTTNMPYSSDIYEPPAKMVGKQTDTIRITQTLSKSQANAGVMFTYAYSFMAKDASGNQSGANLRIIVP